MKPIGTPDDFKAFMDAQIRVYADHVRQHYGLPDPQSVRGTMWQVAEAIDDSALYVGTNLDTRDHVRVRHILFHKVYWQTTGGTRFVYWERMDK